MCKMKGQDFSKEHPMRIIVKVKCYMLHVAICCPGAHKDAFKKSGVRHPQASIETTHTTFSQKTCKTRG